MISIFQQPKMDYDGYSLGVTRSSMVITNPSDTQLGKRTVDDESYAKRFSLSDYNHAMKSTTNIDHDRAMGQTD